MDIPYEKKFHFRDGSVIGSLEGLKTKIESISYQEFYNHVNAEKNDFANWVRHVLQDDRLADELQRVTSIVETVEILNDFLHPRPITAMRDDNQSRIEQSIFTAPPPAETGPIAVENVPSSTPAIAPQAGKDEALDFTIIEEKTKERPPAAESGDAQGDVKIDGKVSEELFGAPPAQPAPPAAPPGASSAADDQTRLIVKDFMYGLAFGLVIGIILGRIISP